MYHGIFETYIIDLRLSQLIKVILYKTLRLSSKFIKLSVIWSKETCSIKVYSPAEKKTKIFICWYEEQYQKGDLQIDICNPEWWTFLQIIYFELSYVVQSLKRILGLLEGLLAGYSCLHYKLEEISSYWLDLNLKI